MASFNTIAVDKLARLVGTPACPLLIDVRTLATRLLPASLRRSANDPAQWAGGFAGKAVVVICERGREVSGGVAAMLRCAGVSAEILEGGFEAWNEAGLPQIEAAKLPRRDDRGRTLWVTRSRPKVDRIACPWLIRRFVDPAAIFLFVAPSDVAGVADALGARPFDVEGAEWSDRDGLCTFDAIVEDLRLSAFAALPRLAAIVRGADTARPEIAPQAAGLLAASLGLSRMHSDDLQQLEDGMILYDAFYRWCRDAVDETHEPVSHSSRRK